MRRLLSLLIVGACLWPAAARAAEIGRYALVVEGVSGDDEFAKQHRQWLDAIVQILRGKLGYDPAHIIVLAETPKPGEDKSTAEGVKAALAKLSKTLKADDQLFVMLIGHGAGEGADVKFNLVGPDLTVEEWNGLLKTVPGQLVFVDATSLSSPFLAGLAGPNRVVVTATRVPGERYHTMFAEGFIQAFSTDAADLDKNGRISIWEAFAYASQWVAQYYEKSGHLSTEHAMIDDAGAGKGRDASGPAQSGTLAALTYLNDVATPATSDTALQQLYARQRDLTDQVDALRRARPTMAPQAFDDAFEKLIVDLALVSRDIRRRTGAKF